MINKTDETGSTNSNKHSAPVFDTIDSSSKTPRYGPIFNKDLENKWSLPNIKQNLLRHYTATPTDKLFKRFKLGAMLFFLGLVIIYSAYQLFQPSIVQEAITLLGLCLIGSGFLLAMLTQVRMLIGRLIHILFHKH